MSGPSMQQLLWDKAFFRSWFSQQVDIEVLWYVHVGPSHVVVLFFAMKDRLLRSGGDRFSRSCLPSLLLLLFSCFFSSLQVLFIFLPFLFCGTAEFSNALSFISSPWSSVRILTF